MEYAFPNLVTTIEIFRFNQGNVRLLKSDEGSGSGKNHVLDICTKSNANGLGAI